MSSDRAKILFCRCAYADVIPADVRRDVAAALAASGADCLTVADLCGLAADRDPRLREWAGAGGRTVIACYPRAVRWLLHAAGAQIEERDLEVLNMRVLSVREILDRIGVSAPANRTQAGSSSAPQTDWPPWFPVLDYDRCTFCRQCHSFCMFGVYEIAEGKVVVVNPRNCKNNCPACARICPSKAIMFPKSSETPTQGAPVPDETAGGVRGSGIGSGDEMDLLLAKRRQRAEAFRRARRRTSSPSSLEAEAET
jgi:NAD-dependent dihydropyrimidine dehydrogenase PreA subunit